MLGIFLPSLLKKQVQCERCRMQYHTKQDSCPHCEDISDGPALEQHIETHQHQLKANHGLGIVFVGVAALILIVLLLAIGIL